jgi:ubiquinone/menaquinone biosynthesis C-methylase UbiE
MAPSHNQSELIRERFTRTAQQFADFSLAVRSAEAERLVALAAPAAAAMAVDFACGPGTFTQALAARARFVCGVDLTPALLAQARASSQQAGLANLGFACGDAAAAPLPDGAFDLAVCGYSFHHFPAPARVAAELARVVPPGGRVAVVDLILPHTTPSNAPATLRT